MKIISKKRYEQEERENIKYMDSIMNARIREDEKNDPPAIQPMAISTEVEPLPKHDPKANNEYTPGEIANNIYMFITYLAFLIMVVGLPMVGIIKICLHFIPY